jgi:hypothetical protein
MLNISSHAISYAGTQPLWLIHTHTLYYGSVLNVADLAETLCILMTPFPLLYICSVTCIQSHVIAGAFFQNDELCHESSPSCYFTLWWATDFTETHYFKPTHLHFVNIIRVLHFSYKQQHHHSCWHHWHQIHMTSCDGHFSQDKIWEDSSLIAWNHAKCSHKTFCVLSQNLLVPLKWLCPCNLQNSESWTNSVFRCTPTLKHGFYFHPIHRRHSQEQVSKALLLNIQVQKLQVHSVPKSVASYKMPVIIKMLGKKRSFPYEIFRYV